MSKTLFNGERLKAARIYRGLTVAELAEKLSLQRQTVSMYENDKIKNPDFNTITSMSTVLGFPKKFFYEENDVSIRNGSTYFRALLTSSKKYRNEQIQRIDFLAVLYKYLSEYVEFPEMNLPISHDETPEEAAIRLREYWELGDKPIDNLVYLVEQNGLIVTSFDSGTDSIDAFSQMVTIDDTEKYLIGYSNNKNTAARIHFDIAHELGHILMHEWSEDLESLSKEEFKAKEKEANEFASAFLLPREAFLRDVGEFADNITYYIELKKKWKVSISAMIRRSLTLGLIDYDTYQYMMRIMQKKGIMKKEPLDDKLYTAKPSLLKTSVAMLIEHDVITPKEFLDELSFDYSLSLEGYEVESLLGLPKGTLKISNFTPVHELKIKKND